jgi:hypothetical protein
VGQSALICFTRRVPHFRPIPHSIPHKLLNFSPEPPQGTQNRDFIGGMLVKILGTAVPLIVGAKGRRAANSIDRPIAGGLCKEKSRKKTDNR